MSTRLERIREEWGGEDALWLLETVDIMRDYFRRINHRSTVRGNTLPPEELRTYCQEALARLEEPDA